MEWGVEQSRAESTTLVIVEYRIATTRLPPSSHPSLRLFQINFSLPPRETSSTTVTTSTTTTTTKWLNPTTIYTRISMEKSPPNRNPSPILPLRLQGEQIEEPSEREMLDREVERGNEREILETLEWWRGTLEVTEEEEDQHHFILILVMFQKNL